MGKMSYFNWVDYLIIGIIFISGLISFMRGFVKEAVSLAIWVVAFLLSFQFAKPTSVILESSIHSSSVRYGVAFAVIFILVLIAGVFVNALVGTLVSKTGASAFDRFLGVCFGVARGFLMIGALLVLINYSEKTDSPSYKNSRFIPYFNNVAVWMKGYFPGKIASIEGEFLSKNNKEAGED